MSTVVITTLGATHLLYYLGGFFLNEKITVPQQEEKIHVAYTSLFATISDQFINVVYTVHFRVKCNKSFISPVENRATNII